MAIQTSRPSLRIGTICACALGILLILAPKAWAGNFYGATGRTGCNSGNMADNDGHNFQFTALSSVMSGPTTWVIDNAFDPTPIDSWMDQTPDEHTDVRVTDAWYHTLCGYDWWGEDENGNEEPGVAGLATCEDTTNNDRCDQFIVRFNLYYADDVSTDRRRNLACHEIGHTVGLMHRESTSGPSPTTGCMNAGLGPRNGYTGHDIVHLADEY